ncbi:predicted protein [Chaetoceros tenuissimus]|uniref:Uncharacterized protein n=1 Tax=Chaetoceros tenuissimus TaxID=426638 RepID=A0AAD3CPI6_9STRA|nr:predicted protein [Chaetoceros tenuissimus]
MVYGRFLLCVDRNFCSEDFDVGHYRAAMYMILDALSMTLFTEAQREEVKRRLSRGQKQRWRLMSEDSRKRTPVTRLAMSNARAVYHFRVTNLDTYQIVLEGCTQKQVVQSDFGKEYTETTSYSLYHFLTHCFSKRNNIKGAGTIRLTMAGVEYSIERYYREK